MHRCLAAAPAMPANPMLVDQSEEIGMKVGKAVGKGVGKAGVAAGKGGKKAAEEGKKAYKMRQEEEKKNAVSFGTARSRVCSAGRCC